MNVYSHLWKYQNDKCLRQKCRKNQSTHFIFSNLSRTIVPFFLDMWWNMVDPVRPHVKIKCCLTKMRFACRLTTARIDTHIHIIYYLILYNWLIPFISWTVLRLGLWHLRIGPKTSLSFRSVQPNFRSKKGCEQTNTLLFQYNSRPLYVKTYVCFIFAGDVLHMLQERPLLLVFR